MESFLGLLGNVAGGLVNNMFSGVRQQEAQEFSQEQAYSAYQYARQLRQTSYQDTMQDMRLAGLNPILAYQKGGTPTSFGPTPSPSSAPVHDVGIGAGVASAQAATRLNQELLNMQETNKLIQAQRDLAVATTDTEKKKPANVEADTKRLEADEQRLYAATGLTWNEAQIKMTDAIAHGQLADIMSDSKMLPLVGYAMAASWMGGKIGDASKAFLEMLETALKVPGKSSARSITPKNDIPGSVAKPGKPGWQPAPPHPGKGWFSDRFYGVQ